MLQISELNEENWNNLTKNNDHDYRQYFFWGEFKKNFNWGVIRLINSKDNRKCYQLLVKKIWPIIFVYMPGVNNLDFDEVNGIKNFIRKKYRKFLFQYIRVDCLNEISNFLEINKANFNKCLFKKNGNYFLTSKLNGTLDDKIKNCKRKWRNHYKQSFKNSNIIIKKNYNPDPNLIFKLSQDLEKRKKLGPGHSIKEVDYLIRNLNDKLYYVQAELNNEIIGFRAAIKINDQAWDYFSITTINGRQFSIGHRLTLEIYENLQSIGIKKYQYIGDDKEKMKNVYEFKTGTNPKIKEYVGEIEWSNSILTKVIINLYLFIFYSKITPNFLKKTH